MRVNSWPHAGHDLSFESSLEDLVHSEQSLSAKWGPKSRAAPLGHPVASLKLLGWVGAIDAVMAAPHLNPYLILFHAHLISLSSLS